MVKYMRKARTYKKRSFKKTAKRYGKKRMTGTKSLVALIKKVSLKQCETKTTHKIEENVNIYHNSGYIYTNLLRTSQGITDTDTGLTAFSNRLGDEIVARGISIKLWVANKLDRPNVMYRLVVFKYAAGSIPTLASCFTGANPNRMMDKIDTEYITPVYQKIFNLQVGFSQSSASGTDTLYGREAHTYKKIYIPLKNKKIVYNNGGSLPKFIDYGFFIVPYDSYGTPSTDNIASFAYDQTLYFKDP